jgi:hypothetical protein
MASRRFSCKWRRNSRTVHRRPPARARRRRATLQRPHRRPAYAFGTRSTPPIAPFRRRGPARAGRLLAAFQRPRRDRRLIDARGLPQRPRWGTTRAGRSTSAPVPRSPRLAPPPGLRFGAERLDARDTHAYCADFGDAAPPRACEAARRSSAHAPRAPAARRARSAPQRLRVRRRAARVALQRAAAVITAGAPPPGADPRRMR